MMFGEYPGLRREILDSCHGTFIHSLFRHSSKERPEHERAESLASKSLVEYSSNLSSSVTDNAEPLFH